MQGISGRLWAIDQVTSRRIRSLPELAKGGKVSEIFGQNTFNTRAMREKLAKPIFDSLQETIRRGKKLDASIANEVAHAVKEWALEKGASHFCHWFQPQTGLTAEKHDAFLTRDDEGPIERFSGAQLIQSEPDASSFPSGGMRTTFEARGYTAWDPSSPIFIVEGPNGKTLCVPSVFISYHGAALDNKTPLLRSMEVLSRNALAVLRLFGDGSSDRVVPTLGAEQEYFLIDRAFYVMRPDLVTAGRTLIGARPPKGQELEDHYYGSIKPRILAFMQECENELYKLGIPVKTRHNEVAPSQYESATIFEEANVASDNNQVVLETMASVAGRHQLALLLHEKPFAGVNGSGKHCNWSLMDSPTGRNLLEPGATPERNLQFLVFLMAVLKGVHRRAGLLRAAVASAGNDHRLGANEAPPAIISVFLGEQLTRILDGIASGVESGPAALEGIRLGISKLPEVARDNTDRNRTSPLAFTGNKFEFRAVSSASSVAIPVAFLNAAVAEALGELAGALAPHAGNRERLQAAVLEAVREAVRETRPIRFEGNNYAEEWVEEARQRGLPNLRTTPEALAELVRPEAKEFLHRLGVFSPAETEARYHVKLERYVKDIEIEVETLRSLVSTHVLPAAYRQHELLAGAGGAKRAISDALQRLGSLIDDLVSRLAELQVVSDRVAAQGGLEERARILAAEATPAMALVRELADRIEESVADDFWTLPKYREMLLLI